VVRVIFHGCMPETGCYHRARDLFNGIAGAEVYAVGSPVFTHVVSPIARGRWACRRPGGALRLFFSKSRAVQPAQVPVHDNFTGHQNDQAGKPFALVVRMEDRQYDRGEHNLEYRQSFHKPLQADPNGYIAAIQLMEYRYGIPSC
jgi:hypothetical protein